MIEFDSQRWRSRASIRLRRALPRCKTHAQKVTIVAQWCHDIEHINRIEKVVDWCATKNVKVKFDSKIKNGLYAIGDKMIELTCRARPARQLCMLLHECGHHLIGHNERGTRFSMGYPVMENPKINNTFHHRITCLDEEMEAWRRGWHLAERLELGMERQSYDKVRLDCLRSYIKWVSGDKSLTIL